MKNTLTRWIIWYGVIIQFIWGSLITLSPDPLKITALGTLYRFVPEGLNYLLVISGILALWSLLSKNKYAFFALIPQQILLLMAAGSALNSILLSSYADGVLHPRLFIAADQSPAILIAILHIFAILELYSTGWLKKITK